MKTLYNCPNCGQKVWFDELIKCPKTGDLVCTYCIKQSKLGQKGDS